MEKKERPLDEAIKDREAEAAGTASASEATTGNAEIPSLGEYTVPDEPTKEKSVFEDLEAIGSCMELIVPSEKVLTALPVRKPAKEEWFMTHQSIGFRVFIYQDALDQTYLVSPKVVEKIQELVRLVNLRLTVNIKGSAFLWPVVIPTESKPHKAHISSNAAAKIATSEWIRIFWNGQEYTALKRQNKVAAIPEWPVEITNASDMMELAQNLGAFEVIDNASHPVLRELLGLD